MASGPGGLRNTAPLAALNLEPWQGAIQLQIARGHGAAPVVPISVIAAACPSTV
jgi:hypothetical protein